MKKKLLLSTLIISLSCLGLNSSSGEHESSLKWNPKAHVNLKTGTQRNLGQIGILSPLGQDDVSMLFMDARFMRDSQKNMEGNFGVGYRSLNIIPDKILGIYGFFDDRYSKHKNLLYQITFGAELLSTTWDYRLNTYWPLSSPKDIKGGPLKKHYIGYELYETSQKEIPLKGLDYEIGRTVPRLEDLSLYAGGYHFGARHSKPMNGGRFRSVYSFNDYISVNAEFQYDNIRRYSNFFGVCLTIPLGGDEDSKKRQKLSSLERRMTTEVIRDVDVVSNSVKKMQKKEGKYIHFRKGQTGNYTAEQPGQDPLEKPATFKEFVEVNRITHVVDEKGNIIPISHYIRMNNIEKSSQLVREISSYSRKSSQEIENDFLRGKTGSSFETEKILEKAKQKFETDEENRIKEEIKISNRAAIEEAVALARRKIAEKLVTEEAQKDLIQREAERLEAEKRENEIREATAQRLAEEKIQREAATKKEKEEATVKKKAAEKAKRREDERLDSEVKRKENEEAERREAKRLEAERKENERKEAERSAQVAREKATAKKVKRLATKERRKAEEAAAAKKAADESATKQVAAQKAAEDTALREAATAQKAKEKATVKKAAKDATSKEAERLVTEQAAAKKAKEEAERREPERKETERLAQDSREKMDVQEAERLATEEKATAKKAAEEDAANESKDLENALVIKTPPGSPRRNESENFAPKKVLASILLPPKNYDESFNSPSAAAVLPTTSTPLESPYFPSNFNALTGLSSIGSSLEISEEQSMFQNFSDQPGTPAARASVKPVELRQLDLPFRVFVLKNLPLSPLQNVSGIPDASKVLSPGDFPLSPLQNVSGLIDTSAISPKGPELSILEPASGVLSPGNFPLSPLKNVSGVPDASRVLSPGNLPLSPLQNVSGLIDTSAISPKGPELSILEPVSGVLSPGSFPLSPLQNVSGVPDASRVLNPGNLPLSPLQNVSGLIDTSSISPKGPEFQGTSAVHILSKPFELRQLDPVS
ncbi:MAG: hypothetical protein B7Y25_05910 [Alphaproteobacteria bacterium 16-39-46]|nr:MAG: hypothetical protein B7Y25_05910 [Alphaproteobacteria bacterium 16-39-46]OZA42460.1 MAG: hypothetical protein B7X84_05970 [Alphaproteobacteria bacterium 17-39-52]